MKGEIRNDVDRRPLRHQAAVRADKGGLQDSSGGTKGVTVTRHATPVRRITQKDEDAAGLRRTHSNRGTNDGGFSAGLARRRREEHGDEARQNLRGRIRSWGKGYHPTVHTVKGQCPGRRLAERPIGLPLAFGNGKDIAGRIAGNADIIRGGELVKNRQLQLALAVDDAGIADKSHMPAGVVGFTRNGVQTECVADEVL